mmetsp:Transcript_2601/g.5709  ORF Transcript_2601/g.5709 Transcript_2601/m.5709 type:complete len:98 (+) Transcript_2601:122-415(+)
MNLSELTLSVMICGDGRHEEAATQLFSYMHDAHLIELDDGLLIRIPGVTEERANQLWVVMNDKISQFLTGKKHREAGGGWPVWVKAWTLQATDMAPD